MISCVSKPKKEFKAWYKEHSSQTKKSSVAPTLHQKSFYSKNLMIDTIYRSMQGPYEIKKVQVGEVENKLFWLTAYESKVVESNSNSPLEAHYMCHNNLNYVAKEEVPWKLKTRGTNSRIFTLSEGQERLEFPEGFGIPLASQQEFEMVSQVLNHKTYPVNLTTKHQVTFEYYKDQELEKPLIPLYQQAVFITKQLSGPAGEYGLPKLCISHHLDSHAIKGDEPLHDCSIQYEKGEYNPYHDQFDRRYTGHWNLPNEVEELSTNVTPMMALEHDSRIHLIGVHLHPFAKALELWDSTSDSLLYAADIYTKADGFGFDSIGYFSSNKGIPVYQNHQYELRSRYHCTDSLNTHTAMAVMYLYLAE